MKPFVLWSGGRFLEFSNEVEKDNGEGLLRVSYKMKARQGRLMTILLGSRAEYDCLFTLSYAGKNGKTATREEVMFIWVGRKDSFRATSNQNTTIVQTLIFAHLKISWLREKYPSLKTYFVGHGKFIDIDIMSKVEAEIGVHEDAVRYVP